MMEILFDNFSETLPYSEALVALDRAMYWKIGVFELRISIECLNPNISKDRVFKFKLTEEDIELLRENYAATIKSICGLKPYFNFAYSKYYDIDAVD